MTRTQQFLYVARINAAFATQLRAAQYASPTRPYLFEGAPGGGQLSYTDRAWMKHPA